MERFTLQDEETRKSAGKLGRFGLPFTELQIIDGSVDSLYSLLWLQAGFIDRNKAVPEDFEYTKSHLVFVQMPHPSVMARQGREWLEKYWKNLRTAICDQLADSAGSLTSQAISVQIGAIVGKFLPFPYGESVVMVSIVSSVVIKSGIKTICDPKNEEAPKGKYT